MFTRSGAVLLAAVLVTAAAQVEPAGPKPTVRIDVNLVQIDAIVTDAKGKTDAGLNATDFQVFADGRSQVISDCVYVRPERVTGVASEGAASIGFAHTGAPHAGEIRQSVAFVVDDLGLAAESVPLVREALKRFVTEQLQPGDLAAVERTSSAGATPLFTSDRRMLNEAVSRIGFKSVGRSGGSSIAPVKGPHGVFTEWEPQSRQAQSTLQTLQFLQNAANTLAQMPGRRSMVVFSENLQVIFGGKRPDPLALSAFQHAIDAANRGSVAIYTIDPRGEVNDVASAADEFHRMDPTEISAIQLQRGTVIDKSRDGLALLSEQTGGLFFQNTNDLGGALKKVLDDSPGHYSIGFHADPLLLHNAGATPRFHSIQVKVSRPGLRVRSREGFFDLGAPSLKASASEPESIVQALVSPLARDGVHLRLTSLFSAGPSGEYVISSLLHVRAEDLQFVEDSTSARQAEIHVEELVLDAEGGTVGSSGATFQVRLTAQEFEKAQAQGFIFAVRHAVKLSGNYQARVAVRDGGSGRIGAAGEAVEIPNVHGGDFALSSLLLQGQTAPLAIAPAVDVISQIPVSNANESAAVRVFRPGTTVGYGCLIFNAPSNSGVTGKVETETRIYQGEREVYAGKPEQLKTDHPDDPTRLAGRWSLRLGETLKPGHYVLRLTATNGLSKKKRRTAVESMDFDVK